MMPPVPASAIASRDVTVVVQGPWHPDQTPQCLASLSRILPGAEIILSVWKEGSDFPAHTVQADAVLLNPDPGGVDLKGLLSLEVEHRTAVTASNFNRQAVSTLNGLRLASRPYALKLRTDMLLEHAGFLAYAERFQGRPGPLRVFGERIVTTNARSPRRSYSMFVQDFCSFGRTEDMHLLWGTALHPSRDALLGMPLAEREARVLVAEQQLVVSAMRRHHAIPMANALANGSELATLTEQAIAGNFVCLDTRRFGVHALKPSLAWVNEAGNIRLSWLWALKASYAEYLSWCRRHCGSAMDPLIEECRAEYEAEMADVAVKQGLIPAPNVLNPDALFAAVEQAHRAGRPAEALNGGVTLYRAGVRDARLMNLLDALGALSGTAPTA